jgi:ABC-type transport system involved in cytochrome c biogenesis permease subunit
MEALLKKHRVYKFSDKRHPIIGVISVILAVSSFITIMILFLVSSQQQGNSGIMIGLIGILAFFLSVLGLILAVISAREKEIHYTFPIIGMGFNGILMIIYMIIYVVGIWL